jgi:multimeric flavodoxin WrbA
MAKEIIPRVEGKTSMKVLGILGSPRRGGNTEILLEETLKGAAKEGAEVDRIYLTDYTITPCKECHGCDETGRCIILDDMEIIYPKLLNSDVVILASPIFFYGVTAWAKALIDRSQALWAQKYLLKNSSLGNGRRKRKGFFLSVGATKGKKVFEGAILTAKYFFDTFNAEYAGELVVRGVDGKGDILKHPEALQQAFEAGRKLVSEWKQEGLL